MILVSSFSYSQEITGFYLSRYSPVIDMGTMDAWPTVGPVDFYGNPRLQGKSIDMGASEFQDPWERIVTAEISADATIIKGSSVILMASGGEKYTWNTGDSTRTITVTPTVTTTYNVIVEEYGTTDTAEVTITVKDPPILDPIANIGDDLVECINQQILLSANGSDSATYIWSTGETTKEILVTLTDTVLITVQVIELNGTRSDSVMIFVNQNCN